MNKNRTVYIVTTVFLVLGLVASILVGKYPLQISNLLNGHTTSIEVFFNLRLARTIMVFIAGFALSITGYVYQTVFKNPIASPDIIGVSSGACVGAGIAIVFFVSNTFTTAVFAFIGGMLAVLISMTLASLSKEQKITALVLSGIAVSALADAILMLIKMAADPLDKLAALEFWTMGSFASVTMNKVTPVLPVAIGTTILLCLLYRQITLLSLDADEAKMLGVPVAKMRSLAIIVATLAVSVIVSVIGRITFIGLIAPHLMRLLTKSHSLKTMFFSGVLGAAILLFADCFARSISETEIPISILTSIIGAPLLISLVLKGDKQV